MCRSQLRIQFNIDPANASGSQPSYSAVLDANVIVFYNKRMKLDLDPDSAVPLYHQIAESVRYKIATGKLKVGDQLPTLRQAAASWGVNIHTVRHAYSELGNSDLVESSGGAGTRVKAVPNTAKGDRALARFVARITRDAREKYGLTTNTLAALLKSSVEPDSNRPIVYTIECSRSQSDDMASQLRDRWHVAAKPLCFHHVDRPPTDGTLLATYFHYNDLRRLWPAVFNAIHFVAMHPDRSVAGSLREARKVLVAERDPTMLDNILADLARDAGNGVEFESLLVRQADDALQGHSRRPVLFSPRMWDELSDTARANSRAVPLRYLFDTQNIEDEARQLNWRSR